MSFERVVKEVTDGLLADAIKHLAKMEKLFLENDGIPDDWPAFYSESNDMVVFEYLTGMGDYFQFLISVKGYKNCGCCIHPKNKKELERANATKEQFLNEKIQKIGDDCFRYIQESSRNFTKSPFELFLTGDDKRKNDYKNFYENLLKNLNLSFESITRHIIRVTIPDGWAEQINKP